MTQIYGAGSGQTALAATQSSQLRAPAMHSTQSRAPVASDGERASLEQAAKAFEAVFTRQLLSSMRQASLGEEIGASSGLDQFREMSDANMANGLADKGGLGIAQMILQQLDRKP